MFRTRPIPTLIQALGSVFFAVAAGSASAHEAGDDWFEHERAKTDGNPMGITHEVTSATNGSPSMAPQVAARHSEPVPDCFVEEMKRSEGYVAPAAWARACASQVANDPRKRARNADRASR